MRRSDFRYDLPKDRIAQYPTVERSAGRLLCVEDGLSDRAFRDLPQVLGTGDLIVFNDTRVIPARLLGKKPTGGGVEILVERSLDQKRALALVKSSKSPLPGSTITLENGSEVRVEERHGELFILNFPDTVTKTVATAGHVPLPPYISRRDDQRDLERYQTIYAREPGAVAAPTAGLHFDNAVMDALRQRGIESAFITLHVGIGTFQPVRVEQIARHRMHPEYAVVGEDTCTKIEATKQRGNQVVAVGTTVARTLETAALKGGFEPFEGLTTLFITPGFRFRVVDWLLTNFHLPESTLLMLVCAFGGFERIMGAYQHAIDAGYRFYSYGDAMLVSSEPALRQGRGP